MTRTIGEKLKKSRNDKKISLRELATRVELSASFLSQIEQGKASPSIENLKKIANALDVRVSYLIDDEDEIENNVKFVRSEDIKYAESKGSNTKLSLLINSREKNMEPIMYEIAPKGESGRDFYSHDGEEFVYIVEGELDIYIEDTTYHLRQGDMLYFKSNIKHRFKNNTKKQVKALWVVSPPTF
ncbi:MAG: cupin domain-containing protein [Fusobacterium sp.]|nr:cupin domain-containing protein [Fusobacterium sp.]